MAKKVRKLTSLIAPDMSVTIFQHEKYGSISYGVSKYIKAKDGVVANKKYDNFFLSHAELSALVDLSQRLISVGQIAYDEFQNNRVSAEQPPQSSPAPVPNAIAAAFPGSTAVTTNINDIEIVDTKADDIPF